MSEAKEVLIAAGFGMGMVGLLTVFNPIIAGTVTTVGLVAQVAHGNEKGVDSSEGTLRNVLVASIAAGGLYWGLSSPFAMNAADTQSVSQLEDTAIVEQVVQERPAVQTTLQAKPG
jgi:hypothetical protein